ncbi:MAG: transcriptional repressor [Bacteroides sp.]|nr:transcriptional repressor [Bacteroides sp.]MBD5306833.1 transcriptional repressor [Bacteroides sp.]
MSENVSPQSAEARYAEAEARLTSYLRTHARRKTPERFAILREALAMKGHFAIHDLLEAMERTHYHVSRGTVYNTVQLLCDCGVLRRHLLDTDQALYECQTANHLHLVCAGCGKIKEATHPELSRLLITMKYPAFKANYFSATLFGYCNACLRKEKARNKGEKS